MKANRKDRRAFTAQARASRSWEWHERDLAAFGVHRFPGLTRMKRAVVNDFYVVQVFDVATALGNVVHLAVRTADARPQGGEPPWRDMQRIKNELCGEELEAVQVYPKQADVMDQANMYHLFVLPPSWPLPFGLHRECGFVPMGNSVAKLT